MLFQNPPSGILRFVTLPLEIPEKTSFQPWKFCKIVCNPLEIPRSKTKAQENFTLVFLYKTPINSTSFLIGPWDFHVSFLQYPWSENSMHSTLGPCLDFFWNSPSFSRIGINENCAEFVPNHFVPIIQDGRKVLVKTHASYNSCPTPI